MTPWSPTRFRVWRLVSRLGRGSALVLLLALASGCSGAPGASALPPSCSFLSVTQARVLLHHQVQQSHHSSDCYYLARPGAYLDVDGARNSQVRSFVGQLWAYTRAGSRLNWNERHVDGVRALWIPYPSGAGGGGRLSAIYRGYGVLITVPAVGGTNSEAVAVAAMTDAFRNINGLVAR